MEIEKNHLLTVYEKPTQSSPPQFLTSQHIAKLWIELAATYGHKFASFGESDGGTWLRGLCGLSPNQIAIGFNRLIDELRDWPPSLPEFKKLCIGANESELKEYINDFAFSEFDSYYINQMTQRQRDDAIKRAKEPATKLYLESKLNNAVQTNIDQLKLS